MSHDHSVYVLNRATPAPWIAKVDGEFYPAKYYFTEDYTDSEVADDPAQHKQSHVMELLDAGKWTGNIVALPNNRVRVTHPAWFETGEGAPDFRPDAVRASRRLDLGQAARIPLVSWRGSRPQELEACLAAPTVGELDSLRDVPKVLNASL